MGADIHIFVEIKKADKWQRLTEKIFPEHGDRKTDAPFDWRSYGMFGFLADVRNYSEVPPISEKKGLPDDSEWLNEKETDGWGGETTRKAEILDNYYHSFSWLSLKELLDFDYEKEFEDLRYTETTYRADGSVSGSNGAAVAKKGNGNITTFSEFLGGDFFRCLEILKTLGSQEDVRIVFWFDN